MGIEYNKRPIGQTGGLAVPVNSVTLSTAAQNLAVGINAVTYDTSGVASDMILPAIKSVGEVVSVAVNNATTSLEANINTASTATTLFGSTFNTATVASTAGSLVPAIEFTSVSTTQWAITYLSSTVDWTLAATTGSTGQ